MDFFLCSCLGSDAGYYLWCNYMCIPVVCEINTSDTSCGKIIWSMWIQGSLWVWTQPIRWCVTICNAFSHRPSHTQNNPRDLVPSASCYVILRPKKYENVLRFVVFPCVLLPIVLTLVARVTLLIRMLMIVHSSATRATMKDMGEWIYHIKQLKIENTFKIKKQRRASMDIHLKLANPVFDCHTLPVGCSTR